MAHSSKEYMRRYMREYQKRRLTPEARAVRRANDSWSKLCQLLLENKVTPGQVQKMQEYADKKEWANLYNFLADISLGVISETEPEESPDQYKARVAAENYESKRHGNFKGQSSKLNIPVSNPVNSTVPQITSIKHDVTYFKEKKEK
jgi:hypothetical protein